MFCNNQKLITLSHRSVYKNMHCILNFYNRTNLSHTKKHIISTLLIIVFCLQAFKFKILAVMRTNDENWKQKTMKKFIHRIQQSFKAPLKNIERRYSV